MTFSSRLQYSDRCAVCACHRNAHLSLFSMDESSGQPYAGFSALGYRFPYIMTSSLWRELSLTTAIV